MKIRTKEEASRVSYGEAWIAFSGSEQKFMNSFASGPLGELKKLIGPIAALQILGPSETLKVKFEVIKETAIFNRDVPMMDEKKRGEIENSLNSLAGHLVFLFKAAVKAEEILKAEGWKYDPVDGHVTRIRKGKGGSFIRRCISAYYSSLEGVTNNPETREKVKTFLSHYFPPHLLDPRPRGNIYQAIYDATMRQNL